MSRVMPKPAMMMTEAKRRVSAGKPVARMMVARNRVKKVKLPIKPATIPNGLLLPAVGSALPRITGRMGKMQGERMVTRPAIKAKRMRINIETGCNFQDSIINF